MKQIGPGVGVSFERETIRAKIQTPGDSDCDSTPLVVSHNYSVSQKYIVTGSVTFINTSSNSGPVSTIFGAV